MGKIPYTRARHLSAHAYVIKISRWPSNLRWLRILTCDWFAIFVKSDVPKVGTWARFIIDIEIWHKSRHNSRDVIFDVLKLNLMVY